MIVIHPVGNQNVRALITALNEEGGLQSFHTSISSPSGGCLNVIPHGIRRELERRSFSDIDVKKVITYPYFDLARLVAIRLQINYLVDNKKGLLRPENLYEYIDTKVARFILKNSDIRSVYGYDGKCLKSFEAVKTRGGMCAYEAAFGYMPYVNEILREEREINSEWSALIPQFSNESLQRQREELEIADKVVVASSFAKKAVEYSGLQKEVTILPYGSPAVFERNKENRKAGKLEVLYVGALSQQKGISYFFDAVERVGHQNINVKVIGQDISRGGCKKLNTALSNVTYIPSLPHADILKLMCKSDILILPSIAEAFGLVVLEAMSRGLVVITTKNCGASDVIVDGVNGYVVPIRDSELIASKIVELLDKDRLKHMSKSALDTAELMSWRAYKRLVKNMVRGWDVC